MPDAERLKKVRVTMARIKLVLTERAMEYEDPQLRMAAKVGAGECEGPQQCMPARTRHLARFLTSTMRSYCLFTFDCALLMLPHDLQDPPRLDIPTPPRSVSSMRSDATKRKMARIGPCAQPKPFRCDPNVIFELHP